MRVIIFGATGMIGRGVLLECLDSDEIEEILSAARRKTGLVHDKLTEIIHDDFNDLSEIEAELRGFDACFYCLGVSAMAVKEDKYRAITLEYTKAAGETLSRLNQQMTFCFVSGEGTDQTGKSRYMWARVKGQAENALKEYGFKRLYLFRPGYVQPMRGIEPPYKIVKWIAKIYPLLNAIIPNQLTTTEEIGRAIIQCATELPDQEILRNRDIRRLGK